MTANNEILEQEWTLEEKMQTIAIGTLLVHPAVFLTGIYQGFQTSNGTHGTSHPIIPLLIANTLGTSYWTAEDQLEKYVFQRRVVTGKVRNHFASMEEHKRMTKDFLDNSRNDAIIGAGIGAILTPIEYIVGWGTGYALRNLDKVFS